MDKMHNVGSVRVDNTFLYLTVDGQSYRIRWDSCSSRLAEVSIEKVGLDGLRQQIREFEARYSLETSEFYARFLRGEMGDKRDFIVWAGLHELLQRITA